MNWVSEVKAVRLCFGFVLLLCDLLEHEVVGFLLNFLLEKGVVVVCEVVI